MAYLNISYDGIRRRLGLLLSIGRDPNTWKPNATQDVRDIIDSGMRRAYWPMPLAADQPAHQWSFLQPTATLAVVAGEYRYDLPEDFTGIASTFAFAAGDKVGRLARVNDDTIRQLQSSSNRTGDPQYFAIVTKNPTPVTGVAYEVLFYPTPDAARTLNYSYAASPPSLDADHPYPLGGPQCAEMFLEACLAEAEKTLHDVEGVHEKRFRELLVAAILFDKSIATPVQTAPWPFENPATGLNITKAYLGRLIGDFLEYGAHFATWDHSQAQRVKLAVETGLRKFYAPMILPGERWSHEWSFLTPRSQIETVSGEYRYDLPADFAMFDGPLTYAPGSSTLYPSLQQVSEHQVMHRLQQGEATCRPEVYAVRPKALDAAIGTQYEILLWPIADDEYQISYRYKLNPAGLGEEANLPFGGQVHAQTIIEACLAAAEEQKGVGNGLHAKKFEECLRASVSHDRQVSSPATLGYNTDRSDAPVNPTMNWHDYDENIVTYNGIAY